jgi:hypothetical protein
MEENNSVLRNTPAARWSSVVRNVAIWRIVFFCILTFYEYGDPGLLTPFGELDIELDLQRQMVGKDRWFAYQQFHWLQDLHVALGRNPKVASFLQQSGYVLSFLAAIGKEAGIPGWRLYTTAFTLLYGMQFLVKVTNFTNHNYLYLLLMVLTIFSGGGHLSGKPKHEREMYSCEAATIALRAQFATIYGFASLWKLHQDWFAGRIVKGIFLSFELKGKARGIPWSAVEQAFPQIFVFLAVAGFFLDASMFSVATFTRPCTSTTKMFMVFNCLFHVFTTITMSPIIGYSFPATCVSGLAVFLPMCHKHGEGECVYFDQSLVNWIYTYWTNTSGEHTISDNDDKDDDKRNEKDDSDEDDRRNEKDDSDEDDKRNEKDDSDEDDKRNEKDDSDEDDKTRGKKETTNDKNIQSNTNAILPPTWQRLVVLGWVVWQVLFPLRMIVVSSGNFPLTHIGYRYSWTM